MKKFTKEVRRCTLQEFPLAPGSTILYFKETDEESGKMFSELVTEILDADSPKELLFRSDLLNRRYKISLDLYTECDEESLQDIRFGLSRLDSESLKYRSELATNDLELAKARAQRIVCNIHITGLFNVESIIQEFDYCNLDTSTLSIEDITKGLIHVAAVAQRPNPTTYVIPTELANDLEKKYKEELIGKTFLAKVSLGNVFAPGENLLNPFVRAI